MSDPSKNIIENESDHLFICYCTFVNNIKGKKLSIQNVFVTTLQEEKLKTILKTILSLDSDQELVKIFLEYDPTISRSKFVTKWVNGEQKKKQQKQK
jgi:hypothetical protein